MRLTNSLLLGATALALALGCAPSNPGLLADGVLTFDDMCLVTADSAFLLQGTLDIGRDVPVNVRPRGLSYTAAFRVGNNLINNSNRIYPVMADPNRIAVNHIEVTLLGASEETLDLGAGVPNPYLVPADGVIASTTSMDPSFGIATATVIPDGYGQALANMFGAGGTIVVRARVIGTTVGGSTLTSGPVLFPINLCVGCMFQCAEDSMHVGINAPSCSPGQDRQSLCACSGAGLCS